MRICQRRQFSTDDTIILNLSIQILRFATKYTEQIDVHHVETVFRDPLYNWATLPLPHRLLYNKEFYFLRNLVSIAHGPAWPRESWKRDRCDVWWS